MRMSAKTERKSDMNAVENSKEMVYAGWECESYQENWTDIDDGARRHG